MQTPAARDGLHHLPALFMTGMALLMLGLTPLWAVEWYRTPFLGMLLEPNNVVSALRGEGWPARANGVDFADRLLALNDQPMPDADAVMAFLQQNGERPVKALFSRRHGEVFALYLTPLKHPPLSDVFSHFVIPYIVAWAFLLIGLWAYTLRRALRASRALLAFTAGLSVLTSAFLDMDTTRHAVVLWALSLGVAGASLVHLSMVFPQPMRFVVRRPFLRMLSWALFCLWAAPALWALLRSPDPYFYIETWRWGYLFITLATALFLGTLIYRILFSESSLIRQQSRVVIFGALIAFLPALYYITPLAFGIFTRFYTWLVFPALTIFPLSITYAVLRYRLLDVDRFLARALAYALAIGAALALFYGLLALFSALIQQSLHASDPLVIAAYLLLLVIGFHPLRDLAQRGIERLFYRAPADYRRALMSLSHSLVITPDLSQILRTLEEQIQQALAPEKFVLYLYNEELGQYLPHATHDDSAPPYRVEEPLIRLLASSRTPIWLPPHGELPPLLQGVAAYARLPGFALVPLHYEGHLIGFMLLGPRRSGDLYSRDDLDFIAAVAAQSTLALENARLFSNLRRTLDQTLEMKNLMDDIFASMATGIITTDLQRRITLFNRAAQSILGVQVETALGRPLPQALSEVGTRLSYVAEPTFRHGEVLPGTELSLNLPSRGDLHLRLSISPLRDARLAMKGATFVFEDLTERRHLEAERERIRRTFGRVVAPRVRDRLLADPGNLTLDGVKQVVTILFADLGGFTPYSEAHDPETTFKLLNQFLSLAAQVILEEEGTLDKFIGDAVLAIWNSPDQQEDHALRAARAACRIIQRCLEAHRALPQAEQHLHFRIGINTGPAIVGNVGTEALFNYTAIGDTVNLAERLQAAARNGQILLNKTTYDLIADQVLAEQLPPIHVKGRAQAVEVYELKGLR